MLILLLVISILIVTKGLKYWDEFEWLAIIFAIFVIPIILTTMLTIKSFYIDEKIDMYVKENTKIEKEINEIVKLYKQYEEDILEKSNVESPLIVVQKYPELKSDALIKEQINLYIDNNLKIKQLKERAIDYKTSKFWLYFNIGDKQN